MKLINNQGMPNQIFSWLVSHNENSENERAKSISELKSIFGESKLSISATSLIRPMQEVVLLDRNHEKIEKEATEMFDALIGTAIHESLQKMPERGGEMREIRAGTMIKDVLVTGQFDYVRDGKIGDYKTTKVGSYIFGDKEFEYIAQLSVDRYLLLKDPRFKLEIKDIGEIVLMFVDWRDREYTTKKYGFLDAPGYPNKTMKIDFKLWTYEETERFLLRKITDYKIASLLDSHELPPCTDKERWARIGKKKTTFMKCEKYCNAAPFCHQWIEENAK